MQSNKQCNANYNIGTKIIFKNEVLKSNPCNYNDAYILVKDNITIAGPNLV